MVESSQSHWMPCLDCAVRKQQVAVYVVHWMQVLSLMTSLKSTHSLTTTDQKRMLQKRCNFNYHAIKGNLHTVSRLTFWMQECSSFLAGDALRSWTRFKALDETGAMGTICRHETPISFFNLHHGERCCDAISMHLSHCCRLQIIVGFMYRIGYAVFMLEKLHQHFPNHSIQLMYDIACSLEKHLKVCWERGHVRLRMSVISFCHWHRQTVGVTLLIALN